MIAFLRDEPGGIAVGALLKQQPPSCVAHSINVCEAFYDFLRANGEPAADEAIGTLRAIGLKVQEDMDESFWKQAGRLKVNLRIPLADAIAATLAQRFDADIVTCDRGDFERVAQAGVCRVTFIR